MSDGGGERDDRRAVKRMARVCYPRLCQAASPPADRNLGHNTTHARLEAFPEPGRPQVPRNGGMTCAR